MIFSNMVEADAWRDPSILADFLGYQLVQGQVAICIGAGISYDFGLPGWAALIDAIYTSKGASRGKDVSDIRAAEELLEKYFNGEQLAFNKAIHDALYENARYDYATMRANNTLASIASLAMCSSRGSASKIVTSNYDDILETYFRMHGFVVGSVAEGIHWNDSWDITVFHPHGFLPKDEPITDKPLVLDQYSFAKVVGDLANPWHQVWKAIMRSHLCLFIGISGNDINLDSMLTSLADNHPAQTIDRLPFMGVIISKDAEAGSFWAKRKIFNHVVSDYHAAMPKFLFDVCQKAASHREKQLS